MVYSTRPSMTSSASTSKQNQLLSSLIRDFGTTVGIRETGILFFLLTDSILRNQGSRYQCNQADLEHHRQVPVLLEGKWLGIESDSNSFFMHSILLDYSIWRRLCDNSSQKCHQCDVLFPQCDRHPHPLVPCRPKQAETRHFPLFPVPHLISTLHFGCCPRWLFFGLPLRSRIHPPNIRSSFRSFSSLDSSEYHEEYLWGPLHQYSLLSDLFILLGLQTLWSSTSLSLPSDPSSAFMPSPNKIFHTHLYPPSFWILNQVIPSNSSRPTVRTFIFLLSWWSILWFLLLMCRTTQATANSFASTLNLQSINVYRDSRPYYALLTDSTLFDSPHSTYLVKVLFWWFLVWNWRWALLVQLWEHPRIPSIPLMNLML